jgi:hypothetical protein
MPVSLRFALIFIALILVCIEVYLNHKRPPLLHIAVVLVCVALLLL